MILTSNKSIKIYDDIYQFLYKSDKYHPIYLLKNIKKFLNNKRIKSDVIYDNNELEIKLFFDNSILYLKFIIYNNIITKNILVIDYFGEIKHDIIKYMKKK